MDPDFIKEYETGQKITKNAKRRQMRGARRLLQRYHQRRDNLIEVLKAIGAVESADQIQQPQFIKEYDQEFTKLIATGKAKTAWYNYFLRAKALSSPVTLKELALILYHLNQRRGYKDIGELMDEMAGFEKKDEEGYSKSYEILKIVAVSPDNDRKGKREVYNVTLEDGRKPCTTTSKVLNEMIGQEKELEVRVRTNKKGEITYELALPDNAAWQYRLDALNKKLTDSELTPGNFFWRKLHNEPNYRVKQNLVYRDRYLDEYDQIMAEQIKHHPFLVDPKIYIDILTKLIPANIPERNRWKSSGLISFIRNYIIYYQRPLKSQRHNVDVCRYEKGFKTYDENGDILVNRPAYVAPSSSPLFQQFRVWQDLAHLGFKDKYGYTTLLSNTEKEILYRELLRVGEITHSAIYKILGKDKKLFPEINRPEDKKIAGNETLNLLKKALTRVEYNNLRLLEEDETFLERLWHLLYSVKDQNARKKSLIRQFGFTDSEAMSLMSVNFPGGHSNLSSKAIKKLLPLMRAGNYYIERDVCPEAKNQINEFLSGTFNEVDVNKVTKITEGRLSVSDFQGLLYWEAAWLVYGSHTTNDDAEPFKQPDDIKRFPLHSLRNPVVEQIVNETLMVMKDIWNTYGKPDEIVVELAREMKMTADNRKKMTEANSKAEKIRKACAKELIEQFNKPNPSRNDILKYQLWNQQYKRCIYSGESIQAGDIFSGAVDIDHIIPRQRFFDDSQNNKVLAFKTENQNKGNKTAYEYMNQTGRWEGYKERVDALRSTKGINMKKYNLLLAEEIPDDFINRQLQETRFIAVKVTSELKRLTPNVRSSIGTITDHLKQSWRLNEVFKEVQLPRFERLESLFPNISWINHVTDKEGHPILQLCGWDKRIDHRHHALDAIIIACTTYSMINQLNHLNTLYGQLQLEGKPAQHFPLPFTGFFSKLRDVLSGIVVSIKSTDKLVTKAKNTITRFDPETNRYYNSKQEKNGWAVRGALHDEQPLGELIRQEKEAVSKVLDKLAANPMLLDEIDKSSKYLAVPWQREAIKKHLALFNNDFIMMKRGLKKMPLLNDYGKAIESITVFKKYYTKIRPIDVSLTLKQVNMIIDPLIKQEVKSLLEQNGGDPKKAFTTDNLISWNAQRKVPVFKVKCKVDDTEVGTSEGRTLLTKQSPYNYIKHIEKGDNYALLINEEITNNKRTFEVISFFDAVDFKLTGIPITSEKHGFKSFILRKNSLVYIPTPEENIGSIDLSQTKRLNERIYRVVKFSGKQFYFIPVAISQVIKNPLSEPGLIIEEYGSQSCTEFHGISDSRIKIAEVCLPLGINRLGQLTKLG
ncbi:MAG: type II CRISPR RNA-guided endonuclease Cas9 [Bacteroidetes bacterium GWE2_42_24]|nr:CRISPR-associated protein Cas9 [uncultured bacterium]OFY13679.1 MAG: type II CRISPR RNA-guided endonuclease Cas9 [Bacteroidetes bacterium GWE2_42_24]OFY32538.1 MAG: type II CRISPR RNA-guided endonuclease Cas9 [Bacteroidetes bacterium GWF2_43_11]